MGPLSLELRHLDCPKPGRSTNAEHHRRDSCDDALVTGRDETGASNRFCIPQKLFSRFFCHPRAISSCRTELELSSVASTSGPCFDTFISAAAYLIPKFSSLQRLHDRFRNYLFHIFRVSTFSCCSPYIPDIAVIVVTIVTMLFPGLLRRPGKGATVDQATACRDDLFFIVFITLFITLFIVFARFGYAEHS